MVESRRPLLKAITLEGFLSFGYGAEEFPLEPLNVLIGPNGSGKSNLVEAVSVLRAVPRDLPLPIRQGGGVTDWLWKGGSIREGDRTATGSGTGCGTGRSEARIELLFAEGQLAKFSSGDPAVRYRWCLEREGDSFVVLDERLENHEPRPGESKPYFYFGYEHDRPVLNGRMDVGSFDGSPSTERSPFCPSGGIPKHTRSWAGWQMCWRESGCTGAGTSVPTRLSGRRAVQTCGRTTCRRRSTTFRRDSQRSSGIPSSSDVSSSWSESWRPDSMTSR